MLAKYFARKSCKERTCLVPLVSRKGSLSETLRLSSKSWNPELLYISRGQFIFSNTCLQFNHTTIQVIPLLKPKRRKEKKLHFNYFSSFSIFCYTLGHRMLLYISLTTTNLKPCSWKYCINWIQFHIALNLLVLDTLTFMPNCRLFCRDGVACLCCIFSMNFFFSEHNVS